MQEGIEEDICVPIEWQCAQLISWRCILIRCKLRGYLLSWVSTRPHKYSLSLIVALATADWCVVCEEYSVYVSFNPRRSTLNTVIEQNHGVHGSAQGTNSLMIKAFGVCHTPVSLSLNNVDPSVLLWAPAGASGDTSPPTSAWTALEKKHVMKNCHLYGI